MQQLQRKAEDRNPDEFYFAMQRSQTKDGVHVARCAPLHLCHITWPWLGVTKATDCGSRGTHRLTELIKKSLYENHRTRRSPHGPHSRTGRFCSCPLSPQLLQLPVVTPGRACRSTEANKYTQVELALMRTQDVGYLRTRAQAESKARFPSARIHAGA